MPFYEDLSFFNGCTYYYNVVHCSIHLKGVEEKCFQDVGLSKFWILWVRTLNCMSKD
ncbi:hypothetical protein KY285_022693 [Solanum tuberosum]|nr:hypothetical protein KY285_022693 [Solanum tuberosum]